MEFSTLSTEIKVCLSVAVECRWMHMNSGVVVVGWGGGE